MSPVYYTIPCHQSMSLVYRPHPSNAGVGIIERFYFAADSDFMTVNMVLTFQSAGQRCMDITLLQDDVLEDDQTFEVVVSSEDAAVRFVNAMTTVTISANGGKKPSLHLWVGLGHVISCACSCDHWVC